MRVGLSYDIFGERPPLQDDFSVLADAGVTHTQMWVWENRIEVGDFAMADRVVGWAGKYGVTIDSVHGPSGYPTVKHWLADPDLSARDWAVKKRRESIQTTAILGAKYMVMEYEIYDRWPFWPHLSPVEAWHPDSQHLFEESFRQVAAEAEAQGVKIALENVSSISAASQMKLLEQYDPKIVGVCFDSCHATYGSDVFAQLDVLAPRIIGTHLSDSDALEGNKWSDRHWPPFAGVIHWERLVRRLARIPFLDVLMVECCCPQNTVTPEVTASLRRLETLVDQCQDKHQASMA